MAGTGKKVQMRAFTVAPWWGLLIVSGQKTIENRTFRVKEGRYLVHCSSSCSESAYLDAVRWVMNRPQLSGVKMPSFRECREVAGCVVGAVVWCNLNEEGNRLTREINGAAQVAGADSEERKEEVFTGLLMSSSVL